MLAFIRMLVGCFLTAVAIVVAAAGAGYWVYTDVTSAGPLAAAHTVIIPPHTGISGITDLLAEEGVIRHPLAFKVAAEVTGRGGALKAGEYEFPAEASAVQVMDIIAGGKTVKHRLTIREGLTSAEIVALAQPGHSLDFLAAAAGWGQMPASPGAALWTDARSDIVSRIKWHGAAPAAAAN